MYELYVEVFRVTAWRDDAVYATKSDGCQWVSKETIDGNRPRTTNVIYAAASDHFAQTNMTIRIKR